MKDVTFSGRRIWINRLVSLNVHRSFYQNATLGRSGFNGQRQLSFPRKLTIACFSRFQAICDLLSKNEVLTYSLLVLRPLLRSTLRRRRQWQVHFPLHLVRKLV